MATLTAAAEKYPTNLDDACNTLPTIEHQPPDFAGHARSNAAKSHPEKRRQYNVEQEAASLFVPAKGKVHQAAAVVR